VVERSATIACTTARDLVIKDFATDPDPSKFATAAHLIVSNLCGSLTQVTCQDLLRSSIVSHVRTLTASTDLDATAVTEVADAVVDANLELCSALLERAAMDRAVREIDDSLATQITQRRHHFDSGIGLDPSLTFAPMSQWTRSLPPMLQPRPGGLTPDQLMVYEAFNRLPRMVSPILTSAPAPGSVPSLNGPLVLYPVCLSFSLYVVCLQLQLAACPHPALVAA
jgi:CCR4-NOT transcription complex subunit 1